MLQKKMDLIKHIKALEEKVHEDCLEFHERDEINSNSDFLLLLFKIRGLLEE